MKRVLMVAFHFPPFSASSGIQRTLAFARHLPRFGWEPLVLTAHPRAYEHVRKESHGEVNGRHVVRRAFALDTARHLSLGGHYPAFAARPDRWSSWWLGAVPEGLAMVRRYRPQVIWSTYPIATAHRIGATLHRLTGLPWVADFRDPMAQDGYPTDPETWKSFKRIEEAALRKAAHSVFVTEGAARMYRDRYAGLPKDAIVVIENGYEEEGFAAIASIERKPAASNELLLLHSGVVYPNERDPTHFFQALRRLLDNGTVRPGTLRVRLRAAGHEPQLKKIIATYGVEQLVELAPSLPYRQALTEMMQADGLLVLQASNCNEQVPAKVYEYLRCGRPIIGLTDPAGDTAALLRRAGIRHIARLDSVDEIASALGVFIELLRSGRGYQPDRQFVAQNSRLERTRELAHVLDAL